MRDMFQGSPHYDRTAEFVELYDNPAFNPAAEVSPISEFEPMLRRVMAAPNNTIYKAAEAEKARVAHVQLSEPRPTSALTVRLGLRTIIIGVSA